MDNERPPFTGLQVHETTRRRPRNPGKKLSGTQLAVGHGSQESLSTTMPVARPAEDKVIPLYSLKLPGGRLAASTTLDGIGNFLPNMPPADMSSRRSWTKGRSGPRKCGRGDWRLSKMTGEFFFNPAIPLLERCRPEAIRAGVVAMVRALIRSGE